MSIYMKSIKKRGNSDAIPLMQSAFMRVVYASLASVLAAIVAPLVKGLRAVMRTGVEQRITEDEYNYIIEVRYFGELVNRRYIPKSQVSESYE